MVVNDLLVRTTSPRLLNDLLMALPGASSVLLTVGEDSYLIHDGCYVIRCFGDVGFLEFALMNQGYAEVVGRLPELL